MIVAASKAGWIRGVDVATGQVRFDKRAHDDKYVNSITFDTTGTSFVTTGGDLTTRVWDRDGVMKAERRDSVTPLAARFAPVGTRILTVASTGKIWDVRTGELLVELVGNIGPMTYAADWSSDGALALTGGVDGTARIWDTATGDMLAIYHHPGRVFDALFSPDGMRLAIVGDDGTIAIHDLPR